MDEANLKERGWGLVTGPGPGKMLSLSTQIPDWGSMSWAQRAYHQGRYGFDRQGTLFLHDHTLQGWPEAREAAVTATVHEHRGRRYAIPGGAIPGSNERLRKLLQDHGGSQRIRAREDTLVWRGTDGSVLLTCPEGWGVPGLVEDGGAYCEFGSPGDLFCMWEGYGEQPPWSAEIPEPAEADRPEGLGGDWELEHTRTKWGIRQRSYREKGRILGSSIIVTDDGQHTLLWKKKHTRRTLTETAKPSRNEDWTVVIRHSGTPSMVSINSKRRGRAEKIGSVENFDLAYAAAHNHVARQLGPHPEAGGVRVQEPAGATGDTARNGAELAEKLNGALREAGERPLLRTDIDPGSRDAETIMGIAAKHFRWVDGAEGTPELDCTPVQWEGTVREHPGLFEDQD